MGDSTGNIPYTRDHVDRAGCLFGEYTYGIPNIYGDGGRLEVGRFCSIAQNVHIFLATNHRTDWITTYPFPALSKISKGWSGASELTGVPHTKGTVVIGNDVWIGFGVIILPGAVIGDGAVIGAGSVVTGAVPPYAVAAGSPATVRKMRFSDAEIARLLEIRWWDWPVERIHECMSILNSQNLEGLFAQAEAEPRQE